MISVCIPVYNFDVRGLIESLKSQKKTLEIPLEIIVIDDASEQNYKNINSECLSGCNYIELSENIGRAKIRNHFLKYAKGDYLLFLDCDSVIIFDTFLQTYATELGDDKQVICGGRIYGEKPRERHKKLRWKYGLKRESLSVERRNAEPNNSFMTNNFIIKKDLFESSLFDERLEEYGHEDTLFGYTLKKAGVQVHHIDNPILNGDIEHNKVYLEKTEKGINNLVQILGYVNYDKDFIDMVSLLKFYYRKKAFSGMIYLTFIIFEKPLKFMLYRDFAQLKCFDFYKLGLFIRYMKKSKRG